MESPFITRDGLRRTLPPRESIHRNGVLAQFFALLKQSGYSDLYVETGAGLARTLVSRWRRGERTPLTANLEAAAGVLGHDLVLVPTRGTGDNRNPLVLATVDLIERLCADPGAATLDPKLAAGIAIGLPALRRALSGTTTDEE